MDSHSRGTNKEWHQYSPARISLPSDRRDLDRYKNDRLEAAETLSG